MVEVDLKASRVVSRVFPLRRQGFSGASRVYRVDNSKIPPSFALVELRKGK